MTPDPQVRQGGEAIRTWTLQGQAPHNTPLIAGPELAENEYARVTELEPVLDLLHSADSAMRSAMATTAIHKSARAEFGEAFREIDAFLREHGRVV